MRERQRKRQRKKTSIRKPNSAICTKSISHVWTRKYERKERDGACAVGYRLRVPAAPERTTSEFVILIQEALYASKIPPLPQEIGIEMI